MVKPTKCAAATMLAIQIQSIAAHPQIGLPQPPRKMQQNIHSYTLTGQRNWLSGLHEGGRLVHEGRIPRENFPAN